MELISVIIPVFNVEMFLARCIDSVIRQTYTRLEIILVDDGSTDNSGKICDEYRLRDNRIVVIHKDNGGLSSARNTGLDVSHGKYIGFVDGDDYISSEMYERLLEGLIQYNGNYSTGGIRELYLSGSELIHGCHGKGTIILDKEEAFIDYYVNLKYNRSSVCCKLFKRELIDSVRFTEGIHGEDADIMYRVIDRVDKVVCINEPIYYYIHRENSITTSGISDHSFDMIKTSDRMLAFFRERYPNLLWVVYVARLRWILDIRREVRDSSSESKKYAEILDDIVKREKKEYCSIRQIPISTKVLMWSVVLGIYNIVYPLCVATVRLYGKVTDL